MIRFRLKLKLGGSIFEPLCLEESVKERCNLPIIGMAISEIGEMVSDDHQHDASAKKLFALRCLPLLNSRSTR